jgi:hypothetical protein
MKSTRKPFVAPRVKEEASLAGVTLLSGGNPTRNLKKHKGGFNLRRNYSHTRHT